MIYCAWISIKFSFSAIFSRSFSCCVLSLLSPLLPRMKFFVGFLLAFEIKIVRKWKKFKNINSIKMNFYLFFIFFFLRFHIARTFFFSSLELYSFLFMHTTPSEREREGIRGHFFLWVIFISSFFSSFNFFFSAPFLYSSKGVKCLLDFNSQRRSYVF